MKWTKFTVKLRNKLAELTCSLDSAACIEDGGFNSSEREELKEKFNKILSNIDKELLKK